MHNAAEAKRHKTRDGQTDTFMTQATEEWCLCQSVNTENAHRHMRQATDAWCLCKAVNTDKAGNAAEIN